MTESLVLLVDGRYDDYALERTAIERAGGELQVHGGVPVTEAEVLALPGLSDAAVLLVELAPITRAVLEAATSCRAVVRYGTGADNVDGEAAAELGIAVETIAGYAAESVSEHAMALVLAVARRLVQHVARVRAGEWRNGDPELRPVGLVGATIGIVGMGAIGRALAVRARAFGMEVLGHDPIAAGPEVDALAEMLPLADVLRRSDYLSLHLPLMPSTAGMIDAAAIATMPRGAVLVNTSRGPLVNEADLVAALDSGQLSYAALDVVTAPEPLPPHDPLRNHPRILLTPHVGFWSDRAEVALRTAVAAKAVAHLHDREEAEP